VTWEKTNCDGDYDDPYYLSYFTESLSRFSSSPRRADESHYIDVPDFEGRGLENRFTDSHLVYAGRKNRRSYARNKPVQESRAIAIPAGNPEKSVEINLPHEVIRAERLGDDIVLTGHHKNKGLYLSLLKLDEAPRRADTLFIDGRYESEGRSHAFNGVTYSDGSGLMGLPTSLRVKDSRRNYWRSKPILGHGKDAVHPDYECEVSCVDWYGNTRPVFLNGRIFALIGTELIEAQHSGSRMQELKRLDISAPLHPDGALKIAQFSPQNF